MKKLLVVIMLLLLALAVGCAPQPKVEEKREVMAPKPAVQEEQAVEKTEKAVAEAEKTVKEAEAEEVVEVGDPDMTEMGPTEDTDPVYLMSYKTTPLSEDSAELTSVKFTVRNWGDKPMRPRVLVTVYGQGMQSETMQFDYNNDLPPKYKMMKDEKVNIKVDAPKLAHMVMVAAVDMNNDMAEWGKMERQFIALK